MGWHVELWNIEHFYADWVQTNCKPTVRQFSCLLWNNFPTQYCLGLELWQQLAHCYVRRGNMWTGFYWKFYWFWMTNSQMENRKENCDFNPRSCPWCWSRNILVAGARVWCFESRLWMNIKLTAQIYSSVVLMLYVLFISIIKQNSKHQHHEQKCSICFYLAKNCIYGTYGAHGPTWSSSLELFVVSSCRPRELLVRTPQWGGAQKEKNKGYKQNDSRLNKEVKENLVCL